MVEKIKMECRAIHSWTLSKLIGAFLNLAVAYVLLCCSTVAFFVSKFLGFFGFSLPCSCNCLFSKPDPDHCLQKLLVDCPKNKISDLQLSVRTRFPFDSVWERNEDCQLSFKVVREKKLESGVIELEGEASCSSVSAAIDLPWKNEGLAATEERKLDVKGKGVARTRRQRGNLRRRRRSSTDQMKLAPNSSYDNVRSGAPAVPLSNYGNSNAGKEFSDNSTAFDSHDVVEPSHVMELDHKSWLSSESNGVIVDKDTVPLGSERSDTGQHLEHDGHLENAVRILEQALKEERAARAALFYDLEKERTAAATAADEAMAMILRLQEEKAAIELEARQYERILEEKSSYDAEEMDILKEIIVRREMENHYLEKEVESYMNMLQEKQQSEEDVCNVPDVEGETLLIPVENEKLVMQTASDFTDYAAISVDNPSPLAQCQEEVDSSTPSHDHRYQEKSIVLIGEVKKDEETESNEQYDGKGPEMPGGNPDMKEPRLYDIHVVDDKCTSQDKDNAESSLTHDDTSNAVAKFEFSAEALEAQRVSGALPPLSNSTCESRVSELRRHSIAAVDHERQKLDNEVGRLRERLRSIQAGRSKLNVSLEHRDKGETELLLLDDIANLLQQIRHLTEPQKTMRRTSLPPPGSQDTSKKRRCRSASVELYQSS